MGQATSLRIGSESVRGVRVLVASGDKTGFAPVVSSLRTDGHGVLWVYGATELVFALEVMDDGIGLPPDLLILDSAIGEDTCLHILAQCGRALSLVPVFLVCEAGVNETHESLLEFPQLVVLRRPVETDDLRTAVLNLEVWKRNRNHRSQRSSREPQPASSRFDHLTLTVKGE